MKISIIGIVGLPANYGGFETLAENLVKSEEFIHQDIELIVYCSSTAYEQKVKNFQNCTLRYVPLKANGIQAMFYDMVCLLCAILNGSDKVLLLGHGGSFILPLLRLISSATFITNIDGIEWKRNKWSWIARNVIRVSEWFAVKFSHQIIADNLEIKNYVKTAYNVESTFIAYGGDHSNFGSVIGDIEHQLPNRFALALCRIEPENNVELILQCFARLDTPLIFIGNWSASGFGKKMKENFGNLRNISLVDAVYDKDVLYTYRKNAALYIHGHSAGGTNPALVEMMHFNGEICAYDCAYNRYTTNGLCHYFTDRKNLANQVETIMSPGFQTKSHHVQAFARENYTWSKIAGQYYSLISK